MKRHVLRYTNLFVLYGIRRNCQTSGGNLLLLLTHKKGDNTDYNNY
jgi:hypothetical protein